MCGISGGITQSVLSATECNKIRDLWFMNSSRGVDGSGLFDFKPTAETTSKTHFFKSELASYETAYQKFYDYGVHKDGMWSKSRPNLIATHARAATKGEKTKENAHPFISSDGTVLGTHNGTITGTYPKQKDFETDSQALIETISELGFEEAVEKFATDATNFAAALAILDREDDVFYLYRNSQRPLHFCLHNTTVYYSSAERDLRYCLELFKDPIIHPLKIADGKAEFTNDQIVSLPANKVLKFKLGEAVSTCTVSEVKEPPPYSYSYTGNNQGFFRGLGAGQAGQTNSRGNSYSTNNNTKPYIPSYFFTAGVNTVNMYGGSLLQKDTDMFYAPEFDKYYNEHHFPAVLIWRLKNYDTFKQMFKENWETCTNDAQRKKFIHESGFSKNLIKRILRGGGHKYLKSCIGTVLRREKDQEWNSISFFDVAKGEKVFKNLSDYIRQNPEEFFPSAKKKETTPPSNVIALPDRGNKVVYGHTAQYTTTSFENLIELYNKGCCYCSEQPTFKENIFFLNDADFFCEGCQKMTAMIHDNKGNCSLPLKKVIELKNYMATWDKDPSYYFDLTRLQNKRIVQ